jgi:hypothetical protein
MSKKRKNAGEGYGYMFSGAFAKKSDAVKKEKTRKGSFIKSIYVQGQHRYAVMTPRTNPVKRKKKAPKENPTELLVMGANPSDRELTIPAGSTITIRMNPVNPDRYTSAHARAAGITRQLGGLIETPFQRRVAKMVRKASGSESAILGRAYRRQRASGTGNRGAKKVFHELYGRDNPICGHLIGGEPCTRKPGHRGPHLPQGATMRTRSRLREHWQPNPSAAALHETFTGKEGKWVEVFDEPHMPRGDYAQLGELLALYVKPNSGGQVQQITFSKGARPLVVADETARQIYFVGGNQTLVRATFPAFGAEVRGDGFRLFALGECRRIDYKQRKEHVPDPSLDEWRHEFGEESGIRPVLLYDAQHKRLRLEGGEYQIRAEGIVN